METFVAIAAIILGVLGIIGSVAPALPGPPLGWVGLLCLYIWGSGTNGAAIPTRWLPAVWTRCRRRRGSRREPCG